MPHPTPPPPSPPLAVAGGYRTPEATPRLLLARAFPTCAFYPRMLRIVMHASRTAKRGRYDDAEWISSSWRILRLLEDVGCRFTVQGMEHIVETNGPVVFCSNHMSTLETFVLPVLIHPVKRCTFVVKPDLIGYPVFGPVMRSRDPIVVSRDDPRRDLATVLDEGARRLADGRSIILFPQTTRIVRFDPATFNSLGAKLARAAGVPLVPVALKSDAWENGSVLRDFGRIVPDRAVHIAFGEAMRVSGSGREEHERTVAFIAERLAAWGGVTAESARPRE